MDISERYWNYNNSNISNSFSSSTSAASPRCKVRRKYSATDIPTVVATINRMDTDAITGFSSN